MRNPVRRRTKLMGVALTAAASLVLASCGGGDSGGGADDKTVTIWSSVDQPVQDGLEKVLTEKAKADGITIKWEKIDDINTVIMTKLQAGDTPDIAMIPQPGVVKDIVSRGAAQPLDDVLDMGMLQDSMVPGTLESGTVDGKLYGLLVSMNVKSLVFYNKPAWDKAGYQAPDSMTALEALTDQIKADGGTPWCMGIGSEAATGWPATDWFEDLIMRYGSVDEYNQWVAHEIPFDSDLVKQAAAEFEKLLFTEGNVAGGRESIASTSFGDAGKPMFDKGGPGCWMLKQGSFIVSADFMPESAVADVDKNFGVFGFPPVEAGGDNPVLGGGDLAVMFDDSDSTKTAMKYLSETDAGKEAAPNSSFLSPHKDFDTSLYPTDLTRSIADVAYQSTAFLFDGSDQMPGAVGAGTFWTEMTSWISGQEDLDTALKNIDASWPS
ncbi:MAG: ABC transporter substrate-binding protein [Nocardioides sp.]